MHNFKYFDQKLNREIFVEPERWVWVAIYDDGTELHQFDTSDNRFHRFAEIDQNKLRRFVMRSWHSDQLFSVYFIPGIMKLIHFYRTAKLQVGKNTQIVKFYFFGYEKNINGKTYKFLNFIDYKDNLHSTDRKNFQLFGK